MKEKTKTVNGMLRRGGGDGRMKASRRDGEGDFSGLGN